MSRDVVPGLESKVVALILGAGRASRFGRDKRSALLDEKNTLIFQTISQYRDLGIPVLVCLSVRADDDGLAATLGEQSIACLRCTRAEEGMGATLAQGVAAVGDASAVLVALADMPGLLPQTIERIISYADYDRIVYPVYQQRRGHPVLFGRGFIPALKALSGDSGASGVIRANAESCMPVSVDDAGVVLDVDTPKDLERLQRLLKERASD